MVTLFRAASSKHAHMSAEPMPVPWKSGCTKSDSNSSSCQEANPTTAPASSATKKRSPASVRPEITLGCPAGHPCLNLLAGVAAQQRALQAHAMDRMEGLGIATYHRADDHCSAPASLPRGTRIAERPPSLSHGPKGGWQYLDEAKPAFRAAWQRPVSTEKGIRGIPEPIRL